MTGARVEQSWTPQPPPEPVPGGRAARRRARQRRRRQQVGAALAVLVALTLGLTYALARGSGPPPAMAEPVRTQRTLLFALQGQNGAPVASAVLAHDPAGSEGAVVLLPPDLLVPAGGSPQPLARALTRVSPEQLRAGVGDVLGATVDHSWVLDGPTTGRLVDALGGVLVRVDVTVPVRTAPLRPGRQRLDGPQAVAFAGHRAEGEPETARLARVEQVLRAVLTALPPPAPAVEGVLMEIGRRSVTSLPLPDLATLVAGVGEEARAGTLAYARLPVEPTPAGPRAQARGTTELVDRLLAGSVPPGAADGGDRVLVLDASQRPGLPGTARTRLVREGFVVAGTRPTERAYDASEVLVAVEARAAGERAAAALGLPPAAVRESPVGEFVDVVVVLGPDAR